MTLVGMIFVVFPPTVHHRRQHQDHTVGRHYWAVSVLISGLLILERDMSSGNLYFVWGGYGYDVFP